MTFPLYCSNFSVISLADFLLPCRYPKRNTQAAFIMVSIKYSGVMYNKVASHDNKVRNLEKHRKAIGL